MPKANRFQLFAHINRRNRYAAPSKPKFKKKFIDSIPEPLIEEYFGKKCEDVVSLESFDYESVNKFLDTIQDENLKSSILEDFTHINDISEKMMNFVVKAVHRYGIKTTGEEKRQELAMDIFLNHEEAFDYAYDYYCLFNSSSKMSHHNITADGFEITQEKINRFKGKVGKVLLRFSQRAGVYCQTL